MYNLFEYKNNIYFKNNDDIYIKSISKFKKNIKINIKGKKIKKLSNIKNLNGSFKIICEKCENYGDDGDIEFKNIELSDTNFYYSFLNNKVINNEKSMLIRYSKKDSILVFHYTMSALNYCENSIIFKNHIINTNKASYYEIFSRILENDSITLIKKTNNFSIIYFNSIFLGFFI